MIGLKNTNSLKAKNSKKIIFNNLIKKLYEKFLENLAEEVRNYINIFHTS